MYCFAQARLELGHCCYSVFYSFIHLCWEMKKCLLRVNEQRNILHEIRKRKANWIGHILRWNCLLKQVIEGKIKGEMEVTRRRGRRRRKLLEDLKDRRGYSHLKEEALDRTMWRRRFGGGFEPVVRQNTEWMNEWNKQIPRVSGTESVHVSGLK